MINLFTLPKYSNIECHLSLQENIATENLFNYIGPYQRIIFMDSQIHNLNTSVTELYKGARAIMTKIKKLL